MRNALIYVLDALLSLVVWAFLLRLLMQLVRADFRNPFAGAVLALTNPLILPLRRLLRPIGRLDSASLVAVVAVQLAAKAAVLAVSGITGLPIVVLLEATVVALAVNITYVLSGAIIISVVLSWVAPGGYNPVAALFDSLSRPVLRPFRRLIPPLGGLDLSPIFALILLQAIRIVIGEW
jgi:YggT family protein